MNYIVRLYKNKQGKRSITSKLEAYALLYLFFFNISKVKCILSKKLAASFRTNTAFESQKHC